VVAAVTQVLQCGACAADTLLVQLERCPYDTTPIGAESLSGGSLLLSCDTCGAQWEWHGAWIARITAPDKDQVRAARAARGIAENAET
jgi:hypothetical protein